jgi:hypothetical protein
MPNVSPKTPMQRTDNIDGYAGTVPSRCPDASGDPRAHHEVASTHGTASQTIAPTRVACVRAILSGCTSAPMFACVPMCRATCGGITQSGLALLVLSAIALGVPAPRRYGAVCIDRLVGSVAGAFWGAALGAASPHPGTLATAGRRRCFRSPRWSRGGRATGSRRSPRSSCSWCRTATPARRRPRSSV